MDNASSDETDAWLKDLSGRDPRVLHIRNETNLGFSRANNVGAQVATGRYLMFLNNDTIVQDGWLEAMVAVAEADPRSASSASSSCSPTRTAFTTPG